MKTFQQKDAYSTPWTLKERILMLVWEYCWLFFCVWTPKPLNPWRLVWLRLFGAKISGTPFVHQRARIQIPWNLIMQDRACLGDRTNAYTLGVVEIRARATIAQEVYLCSGTHDFSTLSIPLQTAPIVVEEDAFVGARAFILPGVKIGKRAVIGACSVVTKDVPDDVVAAGQPCRVLRALVRKEGI